MPEDDHHFTFKKNFGIMFKVRIVQHERFPFVGALINPHDVMPLVMGHTALWSHATPWILPRPAKVPPETREPHIFFCKYLLDSTWTSPDSLEIKVMKSDDTSS